MKCTLSYVFLWLFVFLVSTVCGSESLDRKIAEEYAPIMKLSGPGGPGVNMRDSKHSYTDYIPINVDDIVSNSERLPNFVLTKKTTYNGKTFEPREIPLTKYLLNSIIGHSAFKDSANYLDFSPITGGTKWSREDGYKSLKLQPTVYYKVSRDEEGKHKYPIAVQYWFFYLFNDWGLGADHPGDWETITIFLDSNMNPKEAVYSTHYEANRHSWVNIEHENNHPYVYVSNGGHGSYNHPDKTSYPKVGGYTDNHKGDKEHLYPNVSSINKSVEERYKYSLVDLNGLGPDSWINFEGLWGDGHSAPPGPRFREDNPIDAEFVVRESYRNPPKKPDCKLRYNTNIYDPWLWASGYNLDGAKCQIIAPDIKANGLDESVTVKKGDELSIKIGLEAKDYLGEECDWWLAAKTPFGWYYFNASTMSWAYAGSSYTNLYPTLQGPLFNLNTFEALSVSSLPVGKYTFYFAVDTNMNGLLDIWQLYSDSVSIKVESAINSELRVYFDPNPVLPYDGYSPCQYTYREWKYTAYVEELNGVGVTVSEFTWDFYDSDNNWLSQQVDNADTFADGFDDCGTGSTYTEPYSTSCGKLCAWLGGSPSGSVIMTFYGVDDHGNEVSASGRITLDAPPSLPPFIEIDIADDIPRVMPR